MDTPRLTDRFHDSFSGVLEIESPAAQSMPVVFASPHSGQDYPDSFIAQSALNPQALRRSEDSYVNELFSAAPNLGAPLLKALFPRAYLDVNREPYELDPAMFIDALPPYVNSGSARVNAGLGTIARVVATGAEIYRDKLTFAEAERRIETLYRPYHVALANLVSQTRESFGACLLVDCHSMPSIGGPGESDSGLSRVDFVLGDCFGTTCAGAVTSLIERVLRSQGYRVVRNTPYAGGYSTRHYGKPSLGLHAVQIEINRRLYMEETTHVRKEAFPVLQSHLGELILALSRLPISELRP